MHKFGFLLQNYHHKGKKIKEPNFSKLKTERFLLGYFLFGVFVGLYFFFCFPGCFFRKQTQKCQSMFATEKQFRLSAHPSCCNHNIVKAQDFQHDRNPDSDSLCFPAAPAQMQECFLSSPQSPQLSNWGSPALTWKSCQHILISINSRLLNPNHHTECQNETWKHPEKMKK